MNINCFSKEDHAKLMKEVGVILLKSKFEVNLFDFINHIGRPQLTNKEGVVVWEISSKKDSDKLTRSHTLNEFAFHTDASFKNSPPHYLALQVIIEDRLGGGRFYIADSHKLNHEEFTDILFQNYTFLVPSEYLIEIEKVYHPILKNNIYRYRREIMSISPEKEEIFNQFEKYIEETSEFIHLEGGDIILLNNHRFMHKRTKILDQNRYLKRVWYD